MKRGYQSDSTLFSLSHYKTSTRCSSADVSWKEVDCLSKSNNDILFRLLHLNVQKTKDNMAENTDQAIELQPMHDATSVEESSQQATESIIVPIEQVNEDKPCCSR